MSSATDAPVDVIVVGAGNAALTAAIAARHAGRSVRVIEKAPRAHRGGNTPYTGGLFRFPYSGLNELRSIVGENDDVATVAADPYSPEAFAADIVRTTGGRADPVLSRVLVERSNETIRWMVGLGILFEFNRVAGAVHVPGSSIVHLPSGGAICSRHEGLGLSEALFAIAERDGIAIDYETQVERLRTCADGRIAGVRVRDGDGVRQIDGRSVVLGSGGFQANPEMRVAYLGPQWGLVKVRGSRFNTGELNREAFDIGAQAAGHWSGCHATPIDADAPLYGERTMGDKSNRLSYPYCVMLNLDGDRFMDEGEDFNLYTYAKTGTELLKQRAAIGFQIFDATTTPLLEVRYNTGKPVEANTLAELVAGIAAKYATHNFNAIRALATLDAYNAAVDTSVPFVSNVRDGKQTHGLRPEKTNWATRLETPPFHAYGVATGITFTFGGLRINEHAEVLDRVDRPLPGLYAAGDASGGFFSTNYPGGAALTRGAVFGRIAGLSAATYTA